MTGHVFFFWFPGTVNRPLVNNQGAYMYGGGGGEGLQPEFFGIRFLIKFLSLRMEAK